MHKVLRVVTPTSKGVALFLSDRETTPGFVQGIQALVATGKRVIVSDEVAHQFGGQEGISPISQFTPNIGFYADANMKVAGIPEAILIGMSAHLETLSSKSKNIPLIDMVIIDPSYTEKKCGELKMSIEDMPFGDVVSAINPILTNAVHTATSSGRIVITNETDLYDMVDKHKKGVFTDSKFTENYYVEMARTAWEIVSSWPSYINTAMKGAYVSSRERKAEAVAQ